MRMTKKLPDGSYELTDPDQLREAIQRLGQAEDALESLSEQYHAMEAKLEAERSRGHGTRSVTFNRMLAEKRCSAECWNGSGSMAWNCKGTVPFFWRIAKSGGICYHIRQRVRWIRWKFVNPQRITWSVS